ncbi:MAG: ribonuclease HII [Syntrophobacteraceae bacterium]
MTLPADMRIHEETARRQGFSAIAGLDEAGRGPLAGPVVAAAVLLPSDVDLPGVRDSKQLNARQREALCAMIFSSAKAIGIGSIEAAEIDRINVLQATFQAMLLAVRSLPLPPDLLLIDGPYRLPLSIAQAGIPGGDRKSVSIAAASIVAKVHRDRLMRTYHDLYPAYGFDRHKGYGTAMHLEAIQRFGPCPLHRRSFRGVCSPS